MARAIPTGMAKTTKITKMLVAEICLYGNGPTGCGAGWLAVEFGGRLLGDGEPVKDRTFTEAVWGAVDALRKIGIVQGIVAIYAPGGERYALAPIGRVPTFGNLQWTSPAPCHVISAAELEAAAVAS